jgi:hypothetical protein
MEENTFLLPYRESRGFWGYLHNREKDVGKRYEYLCDVILECTSGTTKNNYQAYIFNNTTRLIIFFQKSKILSYLAYWKIILPIDSSQSWLYKTMFCWLAYSI